MKPFINTIFSLLLIVGLISCEDVIDPRLDEGKKIVVVDAWVNNKPEQQTIKISRTQPYFDPSVSNITVDQVYILEAPSGDRYDFTPDTDNIYHWNPTTEKPQFGTVGSSYQLFIAIGDITFTAETSMNRTTGIDTLRFEYREEDSFLQESYFVDFTAIDPAGTDDTYWFRTYKNGNFLNQPSEINIAYDAAFSPGGGVDGSPFIQPIRDATNRFETDEEDNKLISPYTIGDTVSVEIHSISNEAFYYLAQIQEQTDRQGGFGALFATPLANQGTNISGTNNVGEKVEALGFFNVAAVSIKSDTLTAEKAAEARKNPI